jgi:hypothetical protein
VVLIPNPLPGKTLQTVRVQPIGRKRWQILLSASEASRQQLEERSDPSPSDSQQVWLGVFDEKEWISKAVLGIARQAYLSADRTSDFVSDGERGAFAYTAGPAGNRFIVLHYRARGVWLVDSVRTPGGGRSVQLAADPRGGWFLAGWLARPTGWRFDSGWQKPTQLLDDWGGTIGDHRLIARPEDITMWWMAMDARGQSSVVAQTLPLRGARQSTTDTIASNVARFGGRTTALLNDSVVVWFLAQRSNQLAIVVKEQSGHSTTVTLPIVPGWRAAATPADGKSVWLFTDDVVNGQSSPEAIRFHHVHLRCRR